MTSRTPLPLLVPFLAALAFAAPARAEDALSQTPQWHDCFEKDGEVSIAGCTKLLDDPRLEAEWRPNVLKERAVSELNADRFEPALADADAALALKPDFAEGLSFRGFAHVRMGHAEQALKDLDEAIRLDPDNTRAYISRAQAYSMLHRDHDMIANLDEVIKRDATIAYVFNNRGSAHARLGEREKAIADFSEAIRLKPDFAMAWTNRGQAHMEQHENDPAIADFSEALRLDPMEADALHHRGYLYRIAGKSDLAVADYDAVVALDPKNAGALNDACWLRVSLNRELDKARKLCEAALALAPDNANMQDSMGFLLFRERRFAEAVAALDKAIALNPRLASSWFLRGMAKEVLGDKDGAAGDVGRAVSIDPNIAKTYVEDFGVSL